MIGCLHLGHEAIAKWRGFNDSYHHDEYLIQQWNKVTNKKDLTYILGDVTMETSKHYYLLDRLNGRKKVVLGNHDKGKDVPELLKYVEEVGGAVDYKGNLLTHVPIHPNEVFYCRRNIHAHIHHHNKLEDCIVGDSYQDSGSTKQSTVNKYICVDAKLLDFTPKSLEELIK
jgi:calcineurin-like phosphoesterase family protein